MGEKFHSKFSFADMPHNQTQRPRKSNFRNGFRRLGAVAALSSLLFAHGAGASLNTGTRGVSVPSAAPQEAQVQEAHPLALPDVAPLEFEGGTFSIQNLRNGPNFVFEREGVRREVPVSLPPRETIGDPTEIRYGKKYSFMVTKNLQTGSAYAVVMMGAADVAAGRTTLPGHELMNADCILLPGEPRSISFAEDKAFLLYGQSTVRVLEADTGRLRRLEVEGLSDNAQPAVYMGLYFLFQPTEMPVLLIGKVGGSYAAEAHDYAESVLRSFVRYEEADGRLSAFFLDSEGRTIEMRITVGEEGNPRTVRIEER